MSGSPNRWQRSVNPDLDAFCQRHGVMLQERTTYWQITDALMQLGYPEWAAVAQRGAAPILEDVVAVLALPELQADLPQPRQQGPPDQAETAGRRVSAVLASDGARPRRGSCRVDRPQRRGVARPVFAGRPTQQRADVPARPPPVSAAHLRAGGRDPAYGAAQERGHPRRLPPLVGEPLRDHAGDAEAPLHGRVPRHRWWLVDRGPG